MTLHTIVCPLCKCRVEAATRRFAEAAFATHRCTHLESHGFTRDGARLLVLAP